MTQHQKIKQLPLRIFAVILGVLLFGQFAIIHGQTQTTSPDRGFSPGKSYAISDIETIGLYNGNLMLNLPLGSLPAGRGETSGGVILRYDSKIWDVATFDYEAFRQPRQRNNLVESEDGGWQYGYKYRLKLDTRLLGPMEGNCTSGIPESFYPYKLQMVMPDGSKHALSLSSGSNTNESGFMNIFPDGSSACPDYPYPPPLTGTVSFFTTDGTYLRVEVLPDGDQYWDNNTWVMYSPDGTRVIHNAQENQQIVANQRIIDRNNNFVDVIENTLDSDYSNHRTTYIKDQIGRKMVIEYDAVVNQDGTSEDKIHSKGFNGVDVITRVKWKNITVNKAYFAAEIAPYPLPQNYYQNYPHNQILRVVDKVYLPSQVSGNLNYEFGYNVDSTSAIDVGWGEVDKVTLPTGAYATYSYSLDNMSGWNPSTGGVYAETVLVNRPTLKQLHYNREYDGSIEPMTESWTYVATGTVITITSPDGGVTTEHYAGNTEVIPPAAPDYVGGETAKTITGDGTVIERVYKSNVPVNPIIFNIANRYVKYEFVSIKDAAGTLTKTSIKEYNRDKNGNVTQVKEYDYVPYSSVPRNSAGLPYTLPSNITPARITKTDYYNDTPDASSTTYADAESYYLPDTPRIKNAAKSVEIQDGNGNPKSRTEITYDNYSITGNVTERKIWDSFKNGANQPYSNPLSSSNSISTTTYYNGYGMPVLMVDANNNQTQITYDTTYQLFPIQTVSAYGTAINQTSTAEHDFYTGLVKKVTAIGNSSNENVSTETIYDALNRPTLVKAAVDTPLEFWVQTDYNDAARRVIVRSDLETKGDARKVAVQHYDQLSRIRLSRTLEDTAIESPTNEQHGVKMQTRYLSGSPYSYQLTSNPYRAATSNAATSEPTMGWTRAKTVNTGKHSETETFTGASLPAPWGSNTNSTGVVTTDIDGDKTLVTDQSGRRKITKTNSFGHLIGVWEIKEADADTENISFGSPAMSLNGLKTQYFYDILDNLNTINQGVQVRNFSYSSLSRLISAQIPESGTTSYKYDANGNLAQKTDARNVTTTYLYDALNRITQRSYSNEPAGQTLTPTVNYFYDNLPNARGKLIKVSSSISTTEYTSFDLTGKILSHNQKTDGKDYSTSYKYALSGNLIEQILPSGRVMKNTLDANGDLAQVESAKNANASFKVYANQFVYTAAGAISSLRLGNGLFESMQFNSRLQQTQIALGTSQNATNRLKLNFDYGTTANNGNVLSQQINVSPVGNNQGFTASQTYVFDSLNRIRQATEVISNQQIWKQTFQIDRYGNRRFETSGGNTTTLESSCPTAVCNPEINPQNNRLVGFDFDQAGNGKIDSENRQYFYDAENKLIQVNSENDEVIGIYYYCGDGKRVKKVSAQETTIFVYNALGQLIAEYSNQTPVTPQLNYLTTDHLGSPRVITNQNSQVASRRDFMPFGEEIYSAHRTSVIGYAGDNVRQRFTGYEKDTETDLDFAQARYYNNQHGRFSSPDPLLSSGRPTSPQTWNRFAYVLNNPLVFTDPTGLYECKGTVEQCKKFQKSLDQAKAKLDEIKKFYKEDSTEYKDALRAVNAYGNAGEANGVFVAFGELDSGVLGQTTGSLDASGTKSSVTVTIDLDQNKNGSDLLTTIAHEGSHVQDYADYQGALVTAIGDPKDPAGKADAVMNGPLHVTHGQSETRAFGVSSVFAQFSMGGGTGDSPISSSGGSMTIRTQSSPAVKSIAVGGKEIWSSSWKKLDVEKIRANRAAAISEGLKNDRRYAPKLNKPIG